MVDTPYATNGPLPVPATEGAVAVPSAPPAGPQPTAGPWRWRIGDFGEVEVDAGPKEAPIAIAQVSDWRWETTHRQARGEAVANACLIAAAPELLAAARLAESYIGGVYASAGARTAAHNAARDALAAAIARAEGRISSQEGA